MNTLVIAYKNQQGIDRVEILTFKHGLVIEGHGAFAARAFLLKVYSVEKEAPHSLSLKKGCTR